MGAKAKEESRREQEPGCDIDSKFGARRPNRRPYPSVVVASTPAEARGSERPDRTPWSDFVDSPEEDPVNILISSMEDVKASLTMLKDLDPKEAANVLVLVLEKGKMTLSLLKALQTKLPAGLRFVPRVDIATYTKDNEIDTVWKQGVQANINKASNQKLKHAHDVQMQFMVPEIKGDLKKWVRHGDFHNVLVATRNEISSRNAKKKDEHFADLEQLRQTLANFS